MHKILTATHKESNIDILKARDYFFDNARFVNNRLRKICLLGPILISVIGALLVPILRSSNYENLAVWLEQHLDFVVGGIAIVSFAVDYFLEKEVSMNLSKSNALRELYDVRVLGIEENEYQYHYSEEEIAGFMKTAKFMKDKDNYEVWYREIFSDNDVANVICAMADNIIYTYYVYKANAKLHLAKTISVFVLFAGYCVNYAVNDNILSIVNPFILFLAMFDYVKETIGSYITSKDMAQKNHELKRIILEKKDAITADKQNANLILRCIQDVVVSYRENALFIPRYIRERYLDHKNRHFKNGNPFYKELDQVKNAFWGQSISKPMNPWDFEIPSVEDENMSTNMASVHAELVSMLKDVKNCLASHNLSFMLDGGTLLGSCRAPRKGFLPWDDDVDIVIKYQDVDAILQALANDLDNKYDIQHCDNEVAYSPRLATFRIRQKTSVSKVCEKDSELFESYQMRGLFIDVYTYSPIFGPRWVDAIYRLLFIHPLNKRIRKVEMKWKIGTNPKKAYAGFVRLKKKYIKRVMWYTKHAKNKKYVSYTPFYIYDTKKPGPYINVEDVYGSNASGIFEGTEYDIPTNHDAVLKAYYGDNWEISPLSSVSKLTASDGFVEYSNETFDASCYKHMKKVSIYRTKQG